MKMILVGILAIFLTGCVVHDRHGGYRDGYRYSGPKYERKYERKHYQHREYQRYNQAQRDRYYRRHHDSCHPVQRRKGIC